MSSDTPPDQDPKITLPLTYAEMTKQNTNKNIENKNTENKKIINRENQQKQKKDLLPYKSCLKNAIMLDLSVSTPTRKELPVFMNENFPNAISVNLNSRKGILEVGFKTEEERIEAEMKDVIYKDIKINKQKLFHWTDTIIPIYASNIYLQDTIEETKQLLTERMNFYGTVKEIKIKVLDGKYQIPEALIYLKKTPDKVIPRQIIVLGVPMYLTWRGADPICNYCKRADHIVKNCKKLQYKLNNKDANGIDMFKNKITDIDEIIDPNLDTIKNTLSNNNNLPNNNIIDDNIMDLSINDNVEDKEPSNTTIIVTDIQKPNITDTNNIDQILKNNTNMEDVNFSNIKYILKRNYNDIDETKKFDWSDDTNQSGNAYD